MSAATEKDEDEKLCCASCGIAGIDDIKLKDCDDCDLVKYCSDECQKDHFPKHEEACKKRAAELKDEILFRQPESSDLGDCPICCLPLPIDPEKSTLYPCCSKYICNGCSYANKMRESKGKLQHRCLFCRTVMPNTDEEFIDLLMKRVETNDPVAICEMGTERYDEGDFSSAFEYYSNAAALGDADAHYQLSILYRDGQGVEKDKKKELYYAEQAAIGGHPSARHNLGCEEWRNGAVDRAAKHWIIAAKLGFGKSLEDVKSLYKAGHVSKDDFAEALRGHYAAIAATKSPQREEAEKFVNRLAKR